MNQANTKLRWYYLRPPQTQKQPNSEVLTNRVAMGDNLDVIKTLPNESVDLIYADPPFFTGRTKTYDQGHGDGISYGDSWGGDIKYYLSFLRPRIQQMYRILKKTGSIYIHCDWRASHYIKVETDRIFGKERFINEIVWQYSRWTRAGKTFQRMHDTILFYTKDKDYKFNPQFQPYSPVSLKNRSYKKIKINGKQAQDRSQPILRAELLGVSKHDVWDIPALGPTSSERVGYPTQKPEELLDQIVTASSNPGDVVADFFCGSGTTLSVCQKLKRRFIGCDESGDAISITLDRLERGGAIVEGSMINQQYYTLRGGEHF